MLGAQYHCQQSTTTNANARPYRNIVSGGPSIIRKPGAYRSNLELTNSLRSNFLAAQQSCRSEDGDAAANGNGASNGSNGASHRNGHVKPRRRPPLAAWTSFEPSPTSPSEGTFFVPRIDWSLNPPLSEPASAYDITAKLFFLHTASSAAADRAAYAREALGLVLRELGVSQIDLLIASFPGLSFDADCEWEADRLNAEQGDDEAEAATWREGLEVLLRPIDGPAGSQGVPPVRKLGVAEFGGEKLARFLSRVTVPPAVDQINIRNCCNVPPPLVNVAKEKGIELLVHTDCTDILPRGTLRELLGQGLQGAGVLADGPENDVDPEDPDDKSDDEVGGIKGHGDALAGDLTPLWVIKYTALVRDRGVIENKGYFAAAELTDKA